MARDASRNSHDCNSDDSTFAWKCAKCRIDQIQNLISPQVYATGDILDTFIYRIAMLDAQFGPATAMSMFKSVVFMLFYFRYRIISRISFLIIAFFRERSNEYDR